MRNAEPDTRNGIGEDAIEACCTSGSSPPRLVLTDAARARLEAWIAASARAQYGAGVAVTVADERTGRQ